MMSSSGSSRIGRVTSPASADFRAEPMVVLSPVAVICLLVGVLAPGILGGFNFSGKALKPDLRLVGVQAQLYPSMYSLLRNENLPCGGDTLAEGIAVKEPGTLTS